MTYRIENPEPKLLDSVYAGMTIIGIEFAMNNLG